MKTLVILAAAFFAFEYLKKQNGSPCSGCAGSAGCAGCSAGSGSGGQVIPINSIAPMSATATPAGSGQMTIAQHTAPVVMPISKPVVSNVRYPVTPISSKLQTPVSARLPIALRAPVGVMNAYQAAAIAQAFAY